MFNRKLLVNKVATAGVAIVLAASSMSTVAVPVFAAPNGQQQISVVKSQLSQKDREMLRKMFDVSYYSLRYPNIVQMVGADPDALFDYFCNYGIWCGQQPCAKFDVKAYATANKDLERIYTTDVMGYYRHYVENGEKEGRVATVEDAAAQGVDMSSYTKHQMGLDSNGQPRFVRGTEKTAADEALVITGISVNGVIAPTFAPQTISQISSQGSLRAPNGVTNAPKTTTGGASSSSSSAGNSQEDDRVKVDPNNIPKTVEEITKRAAEDYVMYMSYIAAAQKAGGVNYNVPADKSDTPKEGKKYDDIDVGKQKYSLAMENWQSQKPDCKKYMTENEYNLYQTALSEWNNSKPSAEKYIVKQSGKVYLAPNSDKSAAFEQLTEAWLAAKPNPRDFMSVESQGIYDTQVDEWRVSEPQITDYVSPEIFNTEMFQSIEEAKIKYNEDVLQAIGEKTTAMQVINEGEPAESAFFTPEWHNDLYESKDAAKSKYEELLGTWNTHNTNTQNVPTLTNEDDFTLNATYSTFESAYNAYKNAKDTQSERIGTYAEALIAGGTTELTKAELLTKTIDELKALDAEEAILNTLKESNPGFEDECTVNTTDFFEPKAGEEENLESNVDNFYTVNADYFDAKEYLSEHPTAPVQSDFYTEAKSNIEGVTVADAMQQYNEAATRYNEAVAIANKEAPVQSKYYKEEASLVPEKTIAEAKQQYESDKETWEHQWDGYITETVDGQTFTEATSSWKDSKPVEDNLIVQEENKTYLPEGTDIDTQVQTDTATWESNTPEVETYMTQTEVNQIQQWQNANSNWEQAMPTETNYRGYETSEQSRWQYVDGGLVYAQSESTPAEESTSQAPVETAAIPESPVASEEGTGETPTPEGEGEQTPTPEPTPVSEENTEVPSSEPSQEPAPEQSSGNGEGEGGGGGSSEQQVPLPEIPTPSGNGSEEHHEDNHDGESHQDGDGHHDEGGSSDSSSSDSSSTNDSSSGSSSESDE